MKALHGGLSPWGDLGERHAIRRLVRLNVNQGVAATPSPPRERFWKAMRMAWRKLEATVKEAAKGKG
jgi:hypothetical protein